METTHWVGVDWGVTTNQICVVDASREVVLETTADNTGEGLSALTESLLELAVAEHIAIAIETPRAAVVDALEAQGMSVYVINPKQLDRFRDRFTVAGAKDDRRDARTLADALLSDPQAFRRIEASSVNVTKLRELTRQHEDLSKMMIALGNQLRDLLMRFYPQICALGSVHREPWLWELLRRAPLPERGKRLRHATIESILAKHRIRRIDAEQVVATLRSKALPAAPGVAEAYAEHVTMLVSVLDTVHESSRRVDRRIREVLDEMARGNGNEETSENRDTQVLRSLPGVGPFVGATILVEGTEPLARRDYATLRALSGVAPVTRASGKRSGPNAAVSMRRACNQRLRNAVYHWALNTISRDPKSRALYDAHRARGHSHGRALRTVADRLLAMLIAMLRDGTLYDPARRLVPVAVAT